MIKSVYSWPLLVYNSYMFKDAHSPAATGQRCKKLGSGRVLHASQA